MNKFLEKLKNFRFKGTLILFLIFVVLLIFVFVFEKKRPTKTEEREEKKETFIVWDIKKEEIEKIKISFKDTEWEFIKEEQKCKEDDEKCKGETKWLVEKPKKFEAKKEKIDELLDNLAKLEGEKKLTPEKLSDFGLDKPKLKAKIFVKGGKQLEVLLGEDNPEKTKIYAKRADENYVFLVEQSLKDDLEVKEKELEKKK